MNYVSEKPHVDYDKKEKEILESKSRFEEAVVIYNLLLQGLERFDGKKINKRCIRFLKEAGYTVSYEKDQYLIFIYVWGKEIPFGSRYHFSISCNAHEGSLISLEEFTKKYKIYSDHEAAVTIHKYNEVLENLVASVVEYNLAVDEFNSALENVKEAERLFSAYD